MQIRELFTFDIGREITTVIKMDQPDEAANCSRTARVRGDAAYCRQSAHLF